MPPEGKRRLRQGHYDLRGNAPDQSQVVLLLIDVINDLRFPDSRLAPRGVVLGRPRRCSELEAQCGIIPSDEVMN